LSPAGHRAPETDNRTPQPERENAQQTEQIRRLSAQVADERVQRATFEERLSNLERTMQAKNGDAKVRGCAIEQLFGIDTREPS